jgi:hypothetical protein
MEGRKVMVNGRKYTSKKKACQYNTLWGPPRAEDRQLCTNGDQPRGGMGTTPMAFGILLLNNVSEPPALCLSETVKNLTTVIVGDIDSFSLRRRIMR